VSKKFGEWYQKTNKTEDTNKLTLCKMCAFHDAVQAGKHKEVHPPYSPHLTPAGARFADVAAIQKRETAVLRSIPKQAFADSLQKLYERYQQCVVKDGDYFEGQ
jgi:hypothetical protein